MKECCQCGRKADNGFVTYCDECFDNNEEEHEGTFVDLNSYQELELENQKLKQEVEQLRKALSDKSDHRVSGNLI